MKLRLILFLSIWLFFGSTKAAEISVSFSGATTVSEGQGQFRVSANLVRDESDPDVISLSYRTEFSISGQTAATANGDYQPISGTLTWLAGESGSKSFVIRINEDLQKESVEVFDIVLNAIGNNIRIDSFSGSARFTIFIQDNDVVGDRKTNIGTPEQSIAVSFNVFCTELKDAEISENTDEDKLLDICGGFEIASDEETEIALRKISPEEVSSMSRIGQQMLSQQLGNISSRVKSLRQGTTRGSLSQLSLNANGKAIPSWALANVGSDIFGINDSSLDSLIASPVEWFISGSYSFGSYGETANESGFRPHQYGVSTGMDYRYKPNLIGGLAIGLSSSNAEMGGGGGNIKSKGYDILAFATYFYQQEYYFDAVISTGNYSFDSTRNIDFILAGQEINRTALGSTSSQQLGVNFGAGYNKALIKGITLGANAQLSYASNNIAKFEERGANELNLAIDKQNTSTASTQLGFSISKALSHRYGVFLPQLNVRWVHEFADDAKNISGRFISTEEQTDFIFQSDAPDRDYIIVNTGLSWVMRGAKSAFLNYQTLVARKNYVNHTLSLGLRIENLF